MLKYHMLMKESRKLFTHRICFWGKKHREGFYQNGIIANTLICSCNCCQQFREELIQNGLPNSTTLSLRRVHRINPWRSPTSWFFPTADYTCANELEMTLGYSQGVVQLHSVSSNCIYRIQYGSKTVYYTMSNVLKCLSIQYESTSLWNYYYIANFSSVDFVCVLCPVQILNVLADICIYVYNVWMCLPLW